MLRALLDSAYRVVPIMEASYSLSVSLERLQAGSHVIKVGWLLVESGLFAGAFQRDPVAA